MAQNFPGPFEVELTYIVQGLEHKMRLSFNQVIGTYPPGTPATDIMPFAKSGGVGTRNIVDATNDLLSTLQPLYVDGDTSFLVADVYEYAPGTFDRSFIQTFTPVFTGSSPGSTGLASQGIMTFRTGGGGIAKLVCMETAGEANDQIPARQFSASLDAIKDEFIDNDSVWFSRDNNYAVAALRFSNGQNEKIWRKRFRD